MKYVRFNYILIMFSVLFLGAIFYMFFGLLAFPDQSFSFEGESKQEKFYPDAPLIQKIKVTENNFSGMYAAISKFSSDWGNKITLDVLDETCTTVLAHSKITALSWDTPGYKRLLFKPITDSKDKTYCLRLTYSTNHSKEKNRPYISSFEKESEESGYINTGKSLEEQKNRILKLKPAYSEGSAWKNFSKLISRMSQYKPDYFKGISLEILFILSFTLAVVFLFIVIRV